LNPLEGPPPERVEGKGVGSFEGSYRSNLERTMLDRSFALGALGLEWAGVDGTQTAAKVLGASASLLFCIRSVRSNTRRTSI